MNLTDIENLKIGDIIAVYTENSTHTGHYCGIVDSHIPRIVLAGSHKFILQPDEKQCFDHTFSIDLDKIMDVHVIKKVKEIQRIDLGKGITNITEIKRENE